MAAQPRFCESPVAFHGRRANAQDDCDLVFVESAKDPELDDEAVRSSGILFEEAADLRSADRSAFPSVRAHNGSTFSRERREQLCRIRFTVERGLAAATFLLGGCASVTLACMMVKAHVREGRLVVDEPTDLQEGTEIDLLPLDPGDWLDETDRAALHEALRQSDADVAAGRLVDAEEILKELRSR